MSCLSCRHGSIPFLELDCASLHPSSAAPLPSEPDSPAVLLEPNPPLPLYDTPFRRELKLGESEGLVRTDETKLLVTKHDKEFGFDQVWPATVSQDEVFENVENVAIAIANGNNASIIACASLPRVSRLPRPILASCLVPICLTLPPLLVPLNESYDLRPLRVCVQLLA